MIGIVVVTHGQLANELVSAAEMIVPEIPNVTAVSIGWHDDAADAQREIEEAIARVDAGHGVIVLTDMFGGTPTNLSLAFLESDRVEVLTGVNLPMLIKLVSLARSGEHTLLEIAREVCAQGKESIYLASDLLGGDRKLHQEPSARAQGARSETRSESEEGAPRGQVKETPDA